MIEKVQKTEFVLGGNRLVLVKGKGFFDMQELLQEVEKNNLKYNLIRSHVFQESKEYIAVVLLPEKEEI